MTLPDLPAVVVTSSGYNDENRVTARHTIVEVRRALARLLDEPERGEARRAFERDLEWFDLVEPDAATCELAATIAEQLGTRMLDALHLGAAQRIGGQAVTVLTFDVRQAQAARSLGFPVLGA